MTGLVWSFCLVPCSKGVLYCIALLKPSVVDVEAMGFILFGRRKIILDIFFPPPRLDAQR